jgi:alpha-L-fucosidase 2
LILKIFDLSEILKQQMKLHIAVPILVTAICIMSSVRAQELNLWYEKPAQNWNEALPVGNGLLGAMIFGNPQSELLQLNEGTLWSGGPINDNPNPQAPALLKQIREAFNKNDLKMAEDLTKKMQGLFTESYLPLGDLYIDQELNGATSQYRRALDVGNAIATTTFNTDEVQFTREVFASYPDHVIAMRLTASKAKALNISLRTGSKLFIQTIARDNEITFGGRAPSHVDPSYLETLELPVIYNDHDDCRGMRFECKVAIQKTDGIISVSQERLVIRDGTEIVLLISAATSFNGFEKCPMKDGKDEHALVSEYITKAKQLSFAELKQRHLNDYKSLFDRVSLSINGNPAVMKPTDKRLLEYTRGAGDPALEALYFQFGRYLLISSSRPGGVAANLQGIWNHHLRAPWSSNYTTNINTEMNYWMAESCNLSELHEPLFELIKTLVVTGRKTAKNFYGLEGWTLHHNTDIWATTNPVSGSPSWANWPMGGAWISQHLWEHYQFTGDQKFLESTAYPIMKESAQFYMQWLTEDESGYLVTVPSTSPENFYLREDGTKGCVSKASTMDMAIIKDLFGNVIKASGLLHTDDDFRNETQRYLKRLVPYKIGQRGQLQEWIEDYKDEDPHHRHISHLFGLFPGSTITPDRTPLLAAAAKQSLNDRGDGGTGWAKGWKINTWARLWDGDHAYKLVRQQLTITGVEGTDYSNGGGTYINLLDAHPPFQIDGNFGGTSGITEMLLQSHDSTVHLLPALPSAWKSGEVRGLHARGGFGIDVSWADGSMRSATVISTLGGVCSIRSKTPFRVNGIKRVAKKTEYGYLLTFQSKKESRYEVKAL